MRAMKEMKRNSVFLCPVVALLLFCACSREERIPFESRDWPVMGTTANLILKEDFDIGKALRIAKEKTEKLNAEFSVFEPESSASRLNAGLHVKAGDDLVEICKVSEITHSFTGGAFNPMVAPLVELWGFYRGGEKHEFPPSDEAVSDALRFSGFDMLEMREPDPSGIVGRLSGNYYLKPGGRIDFGAIAKGYAVDAAYDALRKAGCTNFLMNIGGNMRASGRDWKIAVRNPSDGMHAKPLEYVNLKDGLAVATSGGYEQFHESDGVRYCHIIDPRTGYPTRGVEQVTVIALDAVTADALSTACFVLGPEASKEVLDIFCAAAIFVVKEEDGKLKTIRVGHFSLYSALTHANNPNG